MHLSVDAHLTSTYKSKGDHAHAVNSTNGLFFREVSFWGQPIRSQKIT